MTIPQTQPGKNPEKKTQHTMGPDVGDDLVRAAAPELLAALKHLDSAVRGLEGLIPSNDGYLRLRLLQSASAIAKAEGQSTSA